MLTCPKCKTEYQDGTLACSQDGQMFAVSFEQGLAAGLIRLDMLPIPIVTDEPMLEFSLEHCGDMEIALSIQPRWDFPLNQVGNPPLRIGRADRTKRPPIIPEVDLTTHIEAQPCRLSRVQAAIERSGDTIVLRSLSTSVTTYHRRTGEQMALPLMSDQYTTLEDYDTIYFGNPKRTHIRLRVRILHP